MKNLLAIATFALTLGAASLPAQAQDYVVNGHAVSPAEAQHLVARGIPPGHWAANGFGIAAVSTASAAAAPPPSGRKCWYVLDELLCD
jgi:hypothetical protein